MNRTAYSPSGLSLVAKRRVLLVDPYATKRDLRAKIMRKLGVEVDCAADISEARSLWQADSYSLVLVDVRNDSAHVQQFCDEIRSAKPPQTVAFLGYSDTNLGTDAFTLTRLSRTFFVKLGYALRP